MIISFVNCPTSFNFAPTIKLRGGVPLLPRKSGIARWVQFFTRYIAGWSPAFTA
jgi:hypothetical protein